MEATAQSYTQPLADIAPQSLQWLWPGYIPVSRITALSGPNAAGKSALALHLAAALSRGRPAVPSSACVPEAPDCPPVSGPASTLIVASQSEAAFTLLPRLGALDADLTRIHIISDRIIGSDYKDLIAHLILAARQRPDARLLILDPLSALLFYRQIRNFAEALDRFAADYHLAVLVVMTPSDYRDKGFYVASAASARLQIEADLANPRQKLLRVLRTQAPRIPDPLPFHLTPAAVCFEPLPAPTPAALADDQTPLLQLAGDFLIEALANGPLTQNELLRVAEDSGLSPIALRRAKYLLKITSFRYVREGTPYWYWRLPDDTRTPDSQ